MASRIDLPPHVRDLAGRRNDERRKRVLLVIVGARGPPSRGPGLRVGWAFSSSRRACHGSSSGGMRRYAKAPREDPRDDRGRDQTSVIDSAPRGVEDHEADERGLAQAGPNPPNEAKYSSFV
jgi:hypothetical protein